MNPNDVTLCYVRPWNSEQFRFICERAFAPGEIEYLSEHSAVDRSGLVASYYRNLKLSAEDCRSRSFVSEDLATDIIARCRLLRALEPALALRHLDAMAMAIQSIVDSIQPVRVFSLTVDSYVIDLLRIYISRQGGSFLGLVPTFANGYFRLTARGEANCFGDAPPQVVDDLRSKLLQNQYQPNFLKKSVQRPMIGVLGRWIRSNLRPSYFASKRLLSRDPYNYHYWSSQQVSKQMSRILPPGPLGDAQWEKKLAADSRVPVYLPLQMYPEATVDYWCTDAEAANYYDSLERTVERYSSELLFVVKEHPNVMGYRPRGWYRSLKTDPRILVVPTFTPSNQLLEKLDSVLVWTGTVGFEAALRGKAVFTLGDPYYASGNRFFSMRDDTAASQIISHIQRCAERPIDSKEQDALLKQLASQLLPGHFKIDGTWTSANPADIADAKQMADSIKALPSFDSLLGTTELVHD